MLRSRELSVCLTCLSIVYLSAHPTAAVEATEPEPLKLSWKENVLTVHGEHIPGGDVRIWYLEAYCRPGSTDRDWYETTIGHTTRLVSAADHRMELECRLTDGVVVKHLITSTKDSVDFRLVAENPTKEASEAHWAQPCIRVGEFTGCDQGSYLAKSFVFADGTLQRMPTKVWAKTARYTPGQVWAARSVDRDDVNPRPLSPQTLDNGLIGCFSSGDKMILATAWEPYQELFQGVIVCLHSDFRIGGLKPGEKKMIRGKLYLVPNDVKGLLNRYRQDFAEHFPER